MFIVFFLVDILFAIRRVSFQLLFCTCLLLIFFALLLASDRHDASCSNNIHISVSIHGLKTHRNRFNIRGNKHCVCAFLPLLLLAGDVHPNPGPRHPKFPCSSCSKAVKNNDQALCCDRCDRWIHSACCGMSAATYGSFQNSSFSWLCPSCGLPSFNSSYFDSSILSETNNSFSVLNSTPEVDINLIPTTTTSKPRDSPTTETKLKAISLNINGLRSKYITLNAEI